MQINSNFKIYTYSLYTFNRLSCALILNTKLRSQIKYANQRREVTLITESGLYSLIMASKLPQARKYKHWVTSEVLPSIRKNGGYVRGQESLSDVEIMARAVEVAGRVIGQIKEQ